MTRVDCLVSPAAGDTTGRVLVLPVGATEQHGPHLPLTTDTDIARGLADAVAAAAPQKVVVGPAVAYGSSGEHQSFPGTLSIGADALRLTLTELCRSATRTWSRVLLISTHGGNVQVVSDAVSLLRSESRDVRAWVPSWGGDAHAGHVETSLMLALSPDRVGRFDDVQGVTEPLQHLLPRMRVDGVAAVSPIGVLGDPRQATAAAGRELIAQAVRELASTISEWGRGHDSAQLGARA